MESSEMKFDLNGSSRNKKLPESLNIVDHVAARMREVKKLYNDIATTKSEMLVHQMLPNHMRRRAMSHNPKRLPLKYRQIHINQMAKSSNGTSAKKKRPSRKYRRKPRNLMKEYTRRKRLHVWLETHIWHAKRYHMKEMWGYKIPYASTDKRYRASYKAAAYHCLVQDISFYGVIEVSGPFEYLKEKFGIITSQECGPTITAKCYTSGTREGFADIFKANSYPLNALARITFIWKPSEDTKRTLWISVHPTSYHHVLEELIQLFDVQNANRNDTKGADLKVITRNDSFTRYPKYTNDERGVEIVELKDTLNRFRLTGPFASAILQKALKPATHFNGNWLGKLMDEDLIFQKAHNVQEKLWTQLMGSSPADVPPHSIFALNAADPRTNRPAKRIKVVSEAILNAEPIIELPKIASNTGMWQKSLRDELLSNMMSSGELCKLRNKNQLVPGIESSFEKDLQPLPIVLIQRPGNTSEFIRSNLGSGWDLIVPSGYGLSMWLSLIRCGAKSGGWREIETISNEMGMEVHLPDTISGKKDDEQCAKLKRSKYFQRPPNKRTNYKKMGISSPFICPFQQLVREWNGGENFYVLRNHSALKELDEVLKVKGRQRIEDLKLPDNVLIPIHIMMDTRGVPGDNGLICLPSKRDIKNSIAQKYLRNGGPVCLEPLIHDETEQIRKSVRINHKKLLKRLRNRRVRVKRRIQATANYNVKIQKSSAEKIIQEQYERMCELWIPECPPTVRRQCSRQVFGYLTKSRFTFSNGKVCGVGYVTRGGFVALQKTFSKFKGLHPFALTRSISSRCYQRANIRIRCDF